MAEQVLGFIIEVKGTDQQTQQLSKLGSEIDQLKARMKLLNDIQRQGTPLTARQTKEKALLTTQLKATRSQYNALNKEILINNGVIKKSSGLFGGMRSAIMSSATDMLGWTAAIGAFVVGISTAIKTVREYDESIANLQKVTGLAKDETRELADEIIKIDTRTSVTALLELATAGGRLGLTGQDLIDFTKSADMAFVALGDSLDGTSEDIALTLGKLGSSFGIEEKYGVGESITRIGSVLNDLGAKTKATEGAIIDFTARLAGVASQAGITLPEVAALGALFDANGQSLEIAATTFQKLLPAMGQDVEKFAKVAGMNVDEFSVLLRDKPFEALQAVAKGAESSEKGLVGLSDTLKNYGVDSARAASIVSLLSSKQGELADMVGIANEAFIENSSLADENAVKQETLDANIGKLGKTWDVFILSVLDGNGAISQALTSFVEGITDAISGMTRLNQTFTELEVKKVTDQFDEFTKAGKKAAVDLVEDLKKVSPSVDELNEALGRALERAKQNFKAAKDRKDLNMAASYKAEADAIKKMLDTSKESTNKKEDEIIDTKKEEERKKAAEKRAEEQKKIAAKEAEELEKARAEGIEKGREFLKQKQDEAFLTDRQLAKERLQQEFQDKIDAIIGNSAAEIELRKKIEEQKRIALDEQAAQWKIEDEEKEAEQALLLEEKQEKSREKELQRLRQHELFKQQIVSESLDIIGTLTELASRSELNRFDRDAKQQLASFQGTEEEKKQLQDKLAKEREQIERKAFERRKKLQIAEIGVNLVKELSYIKANAAGNPANAFTFGAAGITQAAALSALAIAAAAANAAMVAGQKYEQGGFVEGASHSQGGIQMYHKSGQHLGEMEGNEYIVSAKRVREIGKEKLDAINFGGVNPSVSGYFANGGQVPNIQGISSTTSQIQNSFSMEDLSNLISEKMAETVLRTKVVNNAVDTFQTAQNVKNIENSLKFG